MKKFLEFLKDLMDKKQLCKFANYLEIEEK